MTSRCMFAARRLSSEPACIRWALRTWSSRMSLSDSFVAWADRVSASSRRRCTRTCAPSIVTAGGSRFPLAVISFSSNTSRFPSRCIRLRYHSPDWAARIISTKKADKRGWAPLVGLLHPSTHLEGSRVVHSRKIMRDEAHSEVCPSYHHSSTKTRGNAGLKGLVCFRTPPLGVAS